MGGACMPRAREVCCDSIIIDVPPPPPPFSSRAGDDFRPLAKDAELRGHVFPGDNGSGGPDPSQHAATSASSFQPNRHVLHAGLPLPCAACSAVRCGTAVAALPAVALATGGGAPCAPLGHCTVQRLPLRCCLCAHAACRPPAAVHHVLLEAHTGSQCCSAWQALRTRAAHPPLLAPPRRLRPAAVPAHRAEKSVQIMHEASGGRITGQAAVNAYGKVERPPAEWLYDGGGGGALPQSRGAQGAGAVRQIAGGAGAAGQRGMAAAAPGRGQGQQQQGGGPAPMASGFRPVYD